MGSTCKAECSCGFRQDDINFGGTMFNFKTMYHFPHYCTECKSIFDGNLRGDAEIVCSKCSSKNIIPYYDEKLCKSDLNIPRNYEFQQASVVQHGKCLCPICENFTLTFNCYINYD